MHKNSKQRGFSLLEILLSVAIITFFGGISIPVSRTLQIQNDLDIAAETSVQSLRRAQLLAQSSDGDTSWGFQAQTGTYTVFKGASYATRDVNFDEEFNLATNVIPSGITEVVFTKFSGTPSTTGNLVLTGSNGSIITITINAKGFASY